MRQLPIQLSRRQWAGIACIYAAAFGWAAEFIVPFTALPNKAATFAAILATAELIFLLGIFLLGRKTYEQLKDLLVNFIKNSRK